MLRIPLQPISSQALSVNLNGQDATIYLYYTGGNLYMNLFIDNSAVFNGLICRDRTGIKPYKYLSFAGQLLFLDTAGDSDPQPSGLGSRWRLYYLTESEAAANLDGLLYVY